MAGSEDVDDSERRNDEAVSHLKAPVIQSLAYWCKRALDGVVTVTLDNLRRHSVVIALTALLATYLAKIFWYIDTIEIVRNLEMGFLAFIAFDLFLWAFVIAIVLGAEMYLRRRWLNALMTLMVSVLAFVAVSNVFYLLGTGGQINLAVVRVALTRFGEIVPIIAEGLGTWDFVLLAMTIIAPALIPFLFREKWRQDQRNDEQRIANFTLPIGLVILGIFGFAEQQAPQHIGWRLIADNVHTSIIGDALQERQLSPPPSRPDPAPVDTPLSLEAADLPNIIVFIMEATARRSTSLVDEQSPTTPFLANLAAGGLQATSMRAVIPHTSKSIFTILCGVLPGVQTSILETADNFPMRCIAHILADRGYSTAFIQSADGRFEQRPRLVANMGFQHFVALQDIQPTPELLGYLASDDAALIDPSVDWFLNNQGPSLLVVLSSATHHPYELPQRLSNRFDPDTIASQIERYTMLIRTMDAVMAEIISNIEARNDERPTIIVAMGDHGEAFGEHGRHQHDNVFFEEGLHVPFVIHAPDRIEPGRSITQPASLLDVTPTILDIVGIPFIAENFDGNSIVSRQAAESQRQYFACWYDGACAGFVIGSHKFVSLISVESWISFRLDRDPLESQPHIEVAGEQEFNNATRRWYQSHRYSDEGLNWSHRRLFGGAWECTHGRRGHCLYIQNADRH